MMEGMTDISPVLRGRWSPRGFDSNFEISESDVNLLIEAARWAPSARNRQPWRFIMGRRGTETYNKLLPLVAGLSDWAVDASLFVVNLALTTDSPYDPKYDLGAAVQHMVLQAESMGFHGRVFVNFDKEGVVREFELDENLTPITMTAFGKPASDLVKPEREREPIETIRLF